MRGTEAIGRKQVLLIADNPSEMRRLGGMIAAQGHQVVQTTDGPLGFRLAREQHPDLIVLHLESSSMSALEVAQNLKADDETRGIPLVVITAYAKERQEELHANGCDAHVTEASDLEVLTDLLITSLAGERRPAGSNSVGG
jgi:two-component system cell cycle response regulator DivK